MMESSKKEKKDIIHSRRAWGITALSLLFFGLGSKRIKPASKAVPRAKNQTGYTNKRTLG
jgi:uncharacterized membrane protein YidH (DUF202 family)